jgi:hypothetical protein
VGREAAFNQLGGYAGQEVRRELVPKPLHQFSLQNRFQLVDQAGLVPVG